MELYNNRDPSCAITPCKKLAITHHAGFVAGIERQCRAFFLLDLFALQLLLLFSPEIV